MRAVVDTNILVSALIMPHGAVGPVLLRFIEVQGWLARCAPGRDTYIRQVWLIVSGMSQNCRWRRPRRRCQKSPTFLRHTGR